MAGPHDARAIANALIEKGEFDGRSFDPLQLGKLVYFCHAWMLGLYGRGLIKQDVRAWLYGPVVPDVYRSLKKYERHPVTDVIPGIAKIKLKGEERSVTRSGLLQIWLHDRFATISNHP